jgi:hypothetical protein
VIRVFSDSAGVRAFDPQAAAGSLAQIESLAGTVNLTHAVIIFRDVAEPGLTEAEHERLWRAFQVPAFEQIIAADGTLYAGSAIRMMVCTLNLRTLMLGIERSTRHLALAGGRLHVWCLAWGPGPGARWVVDGPGVI